MIDGPKRTQDGINRDVWFLERIPVYHHNSDRWRGWGRRNDLALHPIDKNKPLLLKMLFGALTSRLKSYPGHMARALLYGNYFMESKILKRIPKTVENIHPIGTRWKPIYLNVDSPRKGWAHGRYRTRAGGEGSDQKPHEGKQPRSSDPEFSKAEKTDG